MRTFQLLFFVMLFANLLAQPPFQGTIYFDPDIITSSDPSCIQSTTYKGQGTVTVYDFRVTDWISINAYLFDVVWDDGITSVAQVNPEFGSVAAATAEAEKYAFLIGQLPNCLRQDVDEIWIHKGIEAFGGGNKSILIHTDQGIKWENIGILEEALFHEGTHTSLDEYHKSTSEWESAQNLDNEFISSYAKDNPSREDLAESYLPWFAVRYRKHKISVEDYNSITQAIPNRLNYFDAMSSNLYPLVKKVYTLPYATSDQSFTKQTTSWSSGTIDISSVQAVNISMDLEALVESSLEADQDYLNVFYKVDGGEKTSISENAGFFPAKTISESGISGSELEIIIEVLNSANDETYNVKNIKVTEGVPTSVDNPLSNSQNIYIYPNPASDIIQIKGTNIFKEDVRIYNLLGQDFTNYVIYENNTMDVSSLSYGYYVLMLKSMAHKIYIR